jgi:hypothetical protein
MRKVMLLAAMLAMALAAAAPVFAQDGGGNVGIVNQQANQFGVVNDSVCSQVYNIAVQQYNAGDQTANANALAGANANAGQGGTAAALAVANANAVNIANATDININTVNACLNNVTTNAGQVQYEKTVTPTSTATSTPTSTATSTATGGGGGGATLPETGGASLLALGAGALLVGGGLVARRLAR